MVILLNELILMMEQRISVNKNKSIKLTYFCHP